jgi:hypothetical protein
VAAPRGRGGVGIAGNGGVVKEVVIRAETLKLTLGIGGGGVSRRGVVAVAVARATVALYARREVTWTVSDLAAFLELLQRVVDDGAGTAQLDVPDHGVHVAVTLDQGRGVVGGRIENRPLTSTWFEGAVEPDSLSDTLAALRRALAR